MANYCCSVRTNYFHVKDVEKFKEFVKRIDFCGVVCELWEDTDEEGNPVFGFGGESAIAGLIQHDDECDSDSAEYDEFVDELQKLISENDAVIILETGAEKLRYVVGQATIITPTQYQVINLTDTAIDVAKELLKDEGWSTKCEY